MRGMRCKRRDVGFRCSSKDLHPSHSHLENSLSWIKNQNRKAILTNMHVDLDYETVMNETPKNVEPAFDGMVLDFAFSS